MTVSSAFRQSHFDLFEIELPWYEGNDSVPIDGKTNYQTPKTCQQESNNTYKLFFKRTTDIIPTSFVQPTSIIDLEYGRPNRLNGTIFNCIASAKETPTTLKPAEGLASRGTISLTMSDHKGDPGPLSFTDKGTFLAKLLARNYLIGKKLTVRRYTVDSDHPEGRKVDSAVYIIDSAYMDEASLKVSGKDIMKDIETYGEQFPKPTDCALSADIDDTQTVIEVENIEDLFFFQYEDETYYEPEHIRINDEIMEVVSYDVVNGEITVATRSGDLGFGGFTTEISEHEADDTVYPCFTCNSTHLADLLHAVYLNSDMDNSYIDLAQWKSELDEWSTGLSIDAIFSKSEDPDEFLNLLLRQYMVDMWFNQSTQKIQISAISAWQESQRDMIEGADFYTPKIKENASDRYSRAYVNYQKSLQAESDDDIYYARTQLFTNESSESSDQYGSISVKRFDNSQFLSIGDAFNLTSRYVSRFSEPPVTTTVKMEERQLISPVTGDQLAVGDIVNFRTRDTQDENGDYVFTERRSQIIQMTPSLDIGRVWTVKGMSYVPFTGANFAPITGNPRSIILWEWANRPNQAGDYTFIIDGASVGSDGQGNPAIRAGTSFPAGSTIKIIMINGSQWSAKGGDGGAATVSFSGFNYVNTNSDLTDAENGEDCYWSDGIDTEIYISYGTVDGNVTDGDLYAAGGGSGAAFARSSIDDDEFSDDVTSAIVGGSGGSGIPGGDGGIATLNLSGGQNATLVYEISNGSDGMFSGGGSQEIVEAEQPPFTVTATAAAGGQSVDGGVSSTNIDGPSGWREIEETSASGEGGFSVQGSGITIYCLAADSARFRSGKSVAGVDYTLVDV